MYVNQDEDFIGREVGEFLGQVCLWFFLKKGVYGQLSFEFLGFVGENFLVFFYLNLLENQRSDFSS